MSSAEAFQIAAFQADLWENDQFSLIGSALQGSMSLSTMTLKSIGGFESLLRQNDDRFDESKLVTVLCPLETDIQGALSSLALKSWVSGIFIDISQGFSIAFSLQCMFS